MSLVDIPAVSDILRNCAELYIKPRYRALEDHEIAAKTNPNDLVTQADLDVEAHLMRVLPDMLPGSVVIGEEGVSQGTASIAILQDLSGAVWVADPVDGTHNFVHHKPEFGVMLALVSDGAVQASWIYDVLQDVMFTAERGSGAYKNEDRLNLKDRPQPETLKDMTAHINARYFPKVLRPEILEATQAFGTTYSIGSAAHEYARVATGASHLALYARLKPWDHLPGSLLVSEAGGYIAKWDRSPYTPRDDYAGLLVASSREVWEMAFEQVFGKIDVSAYLP